MASFGRDVVTLFLYEGDYESCKNLIFQCPFFVKIWKGIQSLFNSVINLSSINELLSSITIGWSKHMQNIALAATTFSVWAIWHCGNNKHFNNKTISFHSAIALIIGKTRIIGNASSACMNSSIQEFVIKKQFGILNHPRRAYHVYTVIWNPPLQGRLSATLMILRRALLAWPIVAASSGITQLILLFFFLKIWVQTIPFFVELMSAILAIKIAFNIGWLNLWLECDSTLPVQSYNNPDLVPWFLKIDGVNANITKMGVGL